MSQYKLNIIPFQPINEKINIIFSESKFEGSKPIPVKYLPKNISFETEAENYFWGKWSDNFDFKKLVGINYSVYLGLK